jgi:site-specific DNA-cytosine methylase
VEDDGERTVWLTHSLLLQPDWWETRGYGSAAAWLHRHPERHAVLHASVSVQRHPSSYFPCLPSVTRFGAYPAPCGTARLCFFGFQKIFSARPQERRKKRFSEPSENASLGTPQMAVRRLTPRECERLQGFPDDYTLVEYRGKPAADGPRYKALGNSMAVPVMRWIGERIAAVDAILRDGSGIGSMS